MANIQISELSSFNQVDAQELNQVVGGWYKPKKYDYKPKKYYYKPYGKLVIKDSFNKVTQTNISNIKQVGYYNTAVNVQSNYADI